MSLDRTTRLLLSSRCSCTPAQKRSSIPGNGIDDWFNNYCVPYTQPGIDYSAFRLLNHHRRRVLLLLAAAFYYDYFSKIHDGFLNESCDACLA